jgi:hypothetical protein
MTYRVKCFTRAFIVNRWMVPESSVYDKALPRLVFPLPRLKFGSHTYSRSLTSLCLKGIISGNRSAPDINFDFDAANR